MLRVRRADGRAAPQWGLLAERAVAAIFGVASLPALWGVHTRNGIDLDTGWSAPAPLPFLPAVIVMTVALWWRRSHPVAVALVVCTGFCVLKATGTGQVPVDFSVLLAMEGLGCYAARHRAAAGAAGGVLVVLPLAVRTEWLDGKGPWERVLLPASVVLILVAVPMAVGVVRRRTRLRLEELERQAGDPPAPPKSDTPASESTSRLDALTPREHEVLAMVATGSTNGEIAAAFGISIETVKTHVTRVLTKLAVRNRTEAALLARRYGIRDARVTPSGDGK
ncbi:MAG: helix-turn-helix domain-containing protein [Dermatophilaceae bacterium]